MTNERMLSQIQNSETATQQKDQGITAIYYMLKGTPAGTLLLTSDGVDITGMHWEVFSRRPIVQPDWVEDENVFREVSAQLEEYFTGKRRMFTFSYVFQGTEFQKSVWRELESIPYGEVSSYQSIASAIGRPKAVRAVGTAVGSNPLCIIVPCHRVIRTDGELGGYAGGLPAKQVLLKAEGLM